jgi:hypothetical protein
MRAFVEALKLLFSYALLTCLGGLCQSFVRRALNRVIDDDNAAPVSLFFVSNFTPAVRIRQTARL